MCGQQLLRGTHRWVLPPHPPRKAKPPRQSPTGTGGRRLRCLPLSQFSGKRALGQGQGQGQCQGPDSPDSEDAQPRFREAGESQEVHAQLCGPAATRAAEGASTVNGAARDCPGGKLSTAEVMPAPGRPALPALEGSSSAARAVSGWENWG